MKLTTSNNMKISQLSTRFSAPLGVGGVGALLLCAQLTAQTPPAARAVSSSDSEAVKLSSFVVSTQADVGYRAGNSVSATRIDTPIKDLPFAVTAFTEQFIRDVGTRDITDVLKYAPGVTSGSSGFGGGNFVTMVRGFASSPQRNGFTSPNYVDGSTIQRVEIVKGPASLLYGQIAPGGVVNYITKRPSFQPATSVEFQVGNYDHAAVLVDANQPVVDKRLAVRFNGVFENRLRYIQPYQGTVNVLAPSALVRVTDNSSLTVEYQYYKRDETPQDLIRQIIRVPLSNAGLYPSATTPGRAQFDFDYFGLPAISDRRYNGSSIFDFRRVELENVLADYEVRWNPHWNSRASFAYQKDNLKMKQTGFGDIVTTPPAALFAGVPNDRAAVQAAIGGIINLQRDGSQVLRRMRYETNDTIRRAFQAETAGRIDFPGVVWKPLLGAQLTEGDALARERQLPAALWAPPWNIVDRRTWVDVDQPLSAFLPTFNSRSRTKNRGLYSANQFSLFEDRLLAVAGVRWSRAESQSTNQLNNTTAPNFETKATSPQVGFGYKLRRDLLLYASYSESFSAGNASLRTLNVIDRVAKPFLGSGYEVGLKTDFADGRVSSTLSLFSLKQSNYIFNFVTISPTTGASLFTDIQDGNVVTSEGAELDLTYSPLDNWQVYLALSYGETKYDQIASPTFRYLIGTPPEYAARDRANFWTRYSFRNGGLKGAWIGGGLNYTGRKAAISNNPFLYMPSQTVFDAVVGYDWKTSGRDWSAKVTWKNVTDAENDPTIRLRGEPSRFIGSVTVRY